MASKGTFMGAMAKALTMAVVVLFAGVAQAAHTFEQIDTCYHWLEEDQLQYKLLYAAKNNGALEFYNDEAIYCWRSPLGAYSAWEEHGDTLIRIKFKKGTKVVHSPRNPNLASMIKIGAVIYSNDNKWHEYTITPQAVESWSIYHPNMIAEMKSELRYYMKGEVTDNDVFYPFSEFNAQYLNQNISAIIANYEARVQDKQTRVFGANQGDHFTTSMDLPWQKYLNKGKVYKFIPPQKITVVEASYGLNLSKDNLDNATVKAKAFCDNKTSCSYKVHPKFLDDPAPGKAKNFKILYRCGNDPKVNILKVDTPADGRVLDLNCF
jgi:hypothetical protein